MGTRWGINRTVAQVHALLYLSEKPLHAETIAETLSVARSNVSTSLRELQNWGLVKVVHVLGDRRDHFESMKDVWEMFRQVLEERKRREVDPTIELLRECAERLETGKADAHQRRMLLQMLDFFETIDGLYGSVRKMSTPALVRFAKLGTKARKLIGMAVE
jgi:DNA-binding transcriptional regulator GbsR (MarR family)